MTIPRKAQIRLEHTPYYHCVSRCVRRAFLCGSDRPSGRNYDHRRQWIENRLVLLADVFAIDLLAYAIMSNHYHVVVCIDARRASLWPDEEIVRRWGKVFRLPVDIDATRIALWRERLGNLSWFMRCINEPLARRANREDDCTGHFWESRFKCQALLDESALLKCMVYVDLNPMRASAAKSVIESEYTSIRARIHGYDHHLRRCVDQRQTSEDALPIGYRDYLTLVQWTAKSLSTDVRGRINAPLIISRMGMEGREWLLDTKYFGSRYYRAAGSMESLAKFCKHLGQHWLRGPSPHCLGRTSNVVPALVFSPS